jgi:hypothetical protein
MEKKFIIPQDRFKEYKDDKCWQSHIRDVNYISDIQEVCEKINVTEEEIKNIKVEDLYFVYIDKEEKEKCQLVKEFIEKHEWLGKLPTRPTHRFAAFYKGYLAGVIVMATPNAFSNLLGKENRGLEKLISRGACISWSPKNLGSALIMFSIRWMVKNTEYRVFTAYSDTEAKELGTIYQACNFYYIGQNSGSTKTFFDKNRPHLGWFSDRNFRHRSYYKFYCKEMGLKTEKEWFNGDKIRWDLMPEGVEKKIRDYSKYYQTICEVRSVSPKHKYVYVLGKSKTDTKILRKKFEEINKDKIKPYPKERGK